MSGALAAVIGGPTVTLSGETISDAGGVGVALTVDADGSVYSTIGIAAPSAIDTATDWIRPAVGMADYYVRATLDSGALTSGTTGSWLQLNTDRAWAIVGPGSAILTVEIARDAGGTIIVESGAYSLQVA